MNCEYIKTDGAERNEASESQETANSPSADLENFFVGFIDRKIAALNSGPSSSLEEAEEALFGPVEFEMFEQYLLDKKKPMFRKIEQEQESKFSALKTQLSCPEEITDFIAFEISKFAKIPSGLGSRYSQVYIGSSKEVRRVIYFRDNDYYLDYEKILSAEFNKLRSQPWLKRIMSTLYQ